MDPDGLGGPKPSGSLWLGRWVDPDGLVGPKGQDPDGLVGGWILKAWEVGGS